MSEVEPTIAADEVDSEGLVESVLVINKCSNVIVTYHVYLFFKLKF